VLPEFGSSIEFWRKVYIAAISGEPLQTSSGKRFELHFYRDVSDHVYTESDFKVVFHDWFH